MADTDLVPVGPAATALTVWSADQVDLLRQQVCPGATDDELAFFAQVCRHKNLDPFLGEIVGIMRWDGKAKREVMKIQETVAGLLTIAERSGLYAGQDPPQWAGPDLVWRDAWLEAGPPAVARVAVYRKDWDRPCVGIARYASYVQLAKHGDDKGKPVALWKTAPDFMLEKCAAARALKAAFSKHFARVGVNVADYSDAQRVTIEARLAGLDDDARHELVERVTDGRTDSTRDLTDAETLAVRTEVANGYVDPATGEIHVPEHERPSDEFGTYVVQVGPGGGQRIYVDEHGQALADQPHRGTNVARPDGPPADKAGEGTTNQPPPATSPPPPTDRPDIVALQARFEACTPQQRFVMRAWMDSQNIKNADTANLAQVAIVTAELDRRGWGGTPAG